MIKLKPVITEKSLAEAKDGRYTFVVSKNLTKPMVKAEVEKMFGVKVKGVKTVNFKSGLRRDYSGRKRKTAAYKKATVIVSGDKKIDLFEEKK